MIKLESKNRNYAVNFPETASEIRPEDLAIAVNDINLPKYYCIVAMCSSIRLFDLATAINGANKDTITKVIPVLAKINECDNDMLKGEVGERVIIDRSSLERGVHLATPLSISSNNAMSFINSDTDLKKDILSGKYNVHELPNGNNKVNVGVSPNITLVEFKIVPVNSIVAIVKKSNIFVDPYKVNNDNLN